MHQTFLPESEALTMATNRVSIGQMADAIMESLEEYANLATDDLKLSVRKDGKSVKDEIAATAPKDTPGNTQRAGL